MDEIAAMAVWATRNRSRYQDGRLMDLLDLTCMRARGEIQYGRRLSPDAMIKRWGITRQAVSIRFNSLRTAGLLSYKRGWHGDPGYLIHRIGPDRAGAGQ